MSALVQRALREPVRFDRDIPGPDRKALEVLVAAGVLKKERQGKVTVFAPVVTLAEFRKPKAAKPRENVETWLRKSLAARARIPGADGWKKTAFAQGKFRMMIEGAPCYFAAHVKAWKARNKAALCKGYDPDGLQLVPAGQWDHRTQCALSWERRQADVERFFVGPAPTLFTHARIQRRLANAL